MEIYLIRHTKPCVAKGICYGQSNIDVAESFEEELKKLFIKIPKKFDSIYSSPLKRCKRLAENLISDEIIYDDNLKELNFGDWELRNWNEIDRVELNSWMSDYVNNAPPNGESYKDLLGRIKYFWTENIIASSNKKIAIITHAGVIRATISMILKTDLKSSVNISIDYGNVTCIQSNDNNSITQK